MDRVEPGPGHGGEVQSEREPHTLGRPTLGFGIAIEAIDATCSHGDAYDDRENDQPIHTTWLCPKSV